MVHADWESARGIWADAHDIVSYFERVGVEILTDVESLDASVLLALPEEHGGESVLVFTHYRVDERNMLNLYDARAQGVPGAHVLVAIGNVDEDFFTDVRTGVTYWASY